MNSITISGNVGNIPELRTTPSGVDVCTFSLADGRKGKDGTEHTNWYRITCWRALGTLVHQYVRKGQHVTVFGKVDDIRVWEGRDGWVPSVEVTAGNVDFGSKRDNATLTPDTVDASMETVEEIPF